MSAFIIIFLHLSNVFWALGEKHQSLGGGCLLPERPANGDYELSDCVEGDFSSKCRKIPRTVVSDQVVLKYRCNPGYVLSNNTNHSMCSNGNWNAEPPTCLNLSNGLGGKHQSLRGGRAIGGCLLPERPANGDYEVTDCVEGDLSSKCRKIPKTVVSDHVVLKYKCNPGYVLPIDTKYTICNDGDWNPEPPSCLKLCKELSSDSLDLQCFYHGGKVNCGEPSRPGTELRVKCKAFYHTSDPSASFLTALCLPDGTWTNELYKCVPDLSNVFRRAVEGKHESLGGGCLLPERPANGDYEVTDCVEGDFSSKCRKVAKTIVSEYVVLLYQCNPGYVLSNNLKHSICSYGNWDPQPPSCQKLCEGLSSDSLDLQCFYLGSKVDCGEPSRPGTELKADCKDYYHTSDPSASFSKAKCSPDGTWNKELYKCVPDCGIRNDLKVTPTIKGDTLLHQSEFPWHAGLYRTEGQNLVFSCGATIIHPKAVLTAALCVHDINGDYTVSKIDKQEIQVAVGKYKPSWYTKETTEQKFKVMQIIVDRFTGPLNKFEHDIAILELDKFIKFNDAVMPICFDRGERLSLYKGSNAVGSVVSWDASKTDGKMSDVLKVARFKFLDFHDCLKESNKIEPSFITYDKFCSRLTKDVILERGDNGNALTFPRFIKGREQHFVYGIFSLLVDNGLVVFTNVTEHMKWIDKVLYGIMQPK